MQPLSTKSNGDSLVMPLWQFPSAGAGDPRPSSLRNHRCAEDFAYTDPGSHILKGGDSSRQGLNCQAAVDEDHHVLVTIGVTNQASVAVHLLPWPYHPRSDCWSGSSQYRPRYPGADCGDRLLK